MSQYVLYMYPNCPYCQKVVGYLVLNVDEWHTRVQMRNAHEPDIEVELLGFGGKVQVPCLNVDGLAVYESDEIIRFFEEEKAFGGGGKQRAGDACCLHPTPAAS